MRLVFLLMTLLSGVVSAAPEAFVLDVAEGQAVLLKEKQEGVLIDVGHAGVSRSLLDKLHHYGVSRLNAMILTHLHPDHAAGYFRIKEAFPAASVFSNCHPLPKNISPDTTRWVNDALKKDKQHSCLKAGDKYQLQDVSLRVLWPEKYINHNLNLHSLVIEISYADKNILLMGDAGFIAEQKLLEKRVLKSNYDVLIAGHHGASDASSEEFLKSIQPAFTVISVNKDNIRGYPSTKTLERFKKIGSIIVRTDIHGDIKINKLLAE